jgi:hypothetical protein
MNTEGITLETIKDRPIIGKLRNNWRGRMVDVYDHPSDPSKVVSVGRPIDPKGPAEPIVCVESRADYYYVIRMFPRTFVYD